MKCFHAVFPWALWATECSWGELLLGKQKYRQLFAFLGMFTMSLVLLEISLWKLRETEEFCTTVEFNYMQTSIWKYSNIFQFPNQDTFQARVELHLSFLCLGLAQKKILKNILCKTSVTFRATLRKRRVHLYWDKNRIQHRWKTGTQMHSFTFENEFVYDWCTSIFQHSLRLSLPPVGVRKSRDSSVSSIDLITSDHLKTFTSFLQGLKLDSGKGTRDNCRHPGRSPIAWRGHCVPRHSQALHLHSQNNAVGFSSLNWWSWLSGAFWLYALWFIYLEKYATPTSFQD